MTPTPMQLGMVGLGRMGANTVERLRRGGHEVVGYDRDPAVSEVGSLAELVAKLAPPRVVWMMVPAGAPTEATITALAEVLGGGDLVVDGGNSNFRDSLRRADDLAARGLLFADAGTSGGIWTWPCGPSPPTPPSRRCEATSRTPGRGAGPCWRPSRRTSPPRSAPWRSRPVRLPSGGLLRHEAHRRPAGRVRRPRRAGDVMLAPPPPQAIVVFGASGDLARRKILPALYQLYRQSLLPERAAVVGYARTDWDDDAFREHARGAVEAFSRSPLDEDVWKGFADSLTYLSGAFDEAACFGPLAGHLERLDAERGTEGRRLYYCATPPSAYPVIVARLGECGPQGGNRIVVEKPFGRDLDSARELNRVIHQVFDEPQVFRIDHYLGKETVQNLLVFRFVNSMFERVWNRDAIDHVQLTVAESVGVEGRGAYYEEAGALRDMVQNHLLQVLAFLTMEPPRALEPEAIRDEKVKLLRALRPLQPDDVVRGQYHGGVVDGKDVPGYREEPDVAPDSGTETFVAVRAAIDNWRWAGVPFYLRTGKRLPRRATEATVWFREAPAYLFEDVGLPPPVANHLTVRIQPDEGIAFAFQAKQPGPGFTPQTVRMEFAYGQSFMTAPAEAYERLLHDAMADDHTLFVREDGVERTWEVVSPVLHRRALHPYPAGSWGPEAANDLIAPRRWHLR